MNSCESFPVTNAHFREATLPNRSHETEFLSCAEGESAFDELNGAFNADFAADGEESMKMVGHRNEGVEKIFVLGAVMVEDINKHSGGPIRLQQVAFSCNG